MEYTPQALGQVIRAWRRSAGLTQEQLGQAAKYGRGAAVSVSRVESGLTHPTSERLEGLAVALGKTPEELRAAALAASTEAGEGSESSVNLGPPQSAESTRERLRRIQLEFERRSEVSTSLGDEFDRAHDRARDDFFLPFVRIASLIDGAPPPDAAMLEETTDTGARGEAALRLRVTSYGVANVLAGGAGGAAAGAALGGAAAYGTFMAAVSFGTASTGAAISGLTGVAATNAALALLGGGTLAAGGAGVAGGALLLGGIIATPVLLFAIGGAVMAVRRNRRQQAELAAKLDEADQLIADTARSFDALVGIVSGATSLLDYIALHAGHALRRWESQLGPQPLVWQTMTPQNRDRYGEFVDVAASQLSLLTINVQEIMTSRDETREELIAVANEVLKQSRQVVEARV